MTLSKKVGRILRVMGLSGGTRPFMLMSETGFELERADWKISMAQVIEFETLARFTPIVKWTPNHQRGKIIPFISHRRALYKPACAAYEELDSESSRWPDRDEALYRASLEYAQPLILEEEPLLENSSNINGEELFGVLIPGLVSDGSPFGS